MLAVARSRAAAEGHRILAFAKRNPLTITGVCVGLLLVGYVYHGLEGKIGHVERQQQVVEQRVVKISTCAASPHSRLCLQSITRGVKRCLNDPTCHNLIASATVVVNHSAQGDGTDPSSVPPASSATAGPPAPPATEEGQSDGHPGGAKSPPKTTHPPPKAKQPAPEGGQEPGQEGSEPPAEAPQGGAGSSSEPEDTPEATEPPGSAPTGSQAGVGLCAGDLACIHAELGLPKR